MFRRATFAEVIDALAALSHRPRRCGTREWPYRARCPGHDSDSKNALAIGEREDGTPRLKCFARGCDRRAILEPLSLWFEAGERDRAAREGNSRGARGRSARPPATKPAEIATTDADQAAIAAARRVWGASVDPADTPASAYLAARFAWPPDGIGPALPPAVRWLPSDEAPPKDEAAAWFGMPRGAAGAIVYRFVRPGADARTVAVALEALDAAGRHLEPRWRKWCGRWGGSVFFAGGDEPDLVIAEGPVTALACLWLHPGFRCVALGGVPKMTAPPLAIPAGARVLIESDSGAAGQRGAGQWQDVLHRHGIAAQVAWNPDGLDAADVWFAEIGERAAIIEESGVPRAAAEAEAWRGVLRLDLEMGQAGPTSRPAAADFTPSNDRSKSRGNA